MCRAALGPANRLRQGSGAQKPDATYRMRWALLSPRRASRSPRMGSSIRFLAFAPTYILFSLTLGLAAARARGVETCADAHRI